MNLLPNGKKERIAVPFFSCLALEWQRSTYTWISHKTLPQIRMERQEFYLSSMSTLSEGQASTVSLQYDSTADSSSWYYLDIIFNKYGSVIDPGVVFIFFKSMLIKVICHQVGNLVIQGIL